MRSVICWLFMSGFVVAADPVPKLPYSKENTFFTGPLDAEGWFDGHQFYLKLITDGVTPQNNAYAKLLEAIGPKDGSYPRPQVFFDRLGVPAPPEMGDYYQSFYQWFKARNPDADASKLFEQESGASDRLWTEDDYPLLAAWLKDVSGPLDIALEAAERPKWFVPFEKLIRGEVKISPFDFGGGSDLMILREYAGALAVRSNYHLAQRDYEASWKDIRTMYRFAAIPMAYQNSVRVLIAVAIQARADAAFVQLINAPKLDAKTLQAIEAEWQQCTLPKLDPKQYLMMERCIALHSLSDALRFEAKKDAKSQAAVEKYRTSPACLAMLRSMQTNIGRVEKILALPDHQARDKMMKAIDTPSLLDSLNVLGEMQGAAVPGIAGLTLDITQVMPRAILKVLLAYDRGVQQRRNITVAIALKKYQLATGRFPEKLDDLKPTYLIEIPNDLFIEKPLQYTRTEKGYKLYSVGLNHKDDGGVLDNDKKADDITIIHP
ncbi:MAG: hypothetical protein ACRC8S_18730 [Fimbriiglobus sp.]